MQFSKIHEAFSISVARMYRPHQLQKEMPTKDQSQWVKIPGIEKKIELIKIANPSFPFLE